MATRRSRKKRSQKPTFEGYVLLFLLLLVIAGLSKGCQAIKSVFSGKDESSITQSEISQETELEDSWIVEEPEYIDEPSDKEPTQILDEMVENEPEPVQEEPAAEDPESVTVEPGEENTKPVPDEPIEEEPTPEIIEEEPPAQTADSAAGTTTEYQASYILNTSTMKFHRPGCRYVDKISAENKGYTSSRSDAVSKGYEACKTCKP